MGVHGIGCTAWRIEVSARWPIVEVTARAVFEIALWSVTKVARLIAITTGWAIVEVPTGTVFKAALWSIAKAAGFVPIAARWAVITAFAALRACRTGWAWRGFALRFKACGLLAPCRAHGFAPWVFAFGRLGFVYPQFGAGGRGIGVGHDGP